MAIDEKKTINSWEDKHYKVRIQRRIGWAGPHYYHCRVKKKYLGGLVKKTIVKQTFSSQTFSKCYLGVRVKDDSLYVNFCKKKIDVQELH